MFQSSLSVSLIFSLDLVAVVIWIPMDRRHVIVLMDMLDEDVKCVLLGIRAILYSWETTVNKVNKLHFKCHQIH